MDNFWFPAAHFHLVSKSTGFFELSRQVSSGSLLIKGYKIIILLIGRGDVLDRSAQVTQRLQSLLDAVARVDAGIKVIVTTPLPWPTDEERITRKLFRTGAVLKAFCKGKSQVSFSKITQCLTNQHGIDSSMITRRGLTTPAKQILSKHFSGKISCEQLRLRYHLGLSV